jgi:hypothetical protein
MKLFEEMKMNRRALLSGMLGGLILCVTGSVGCAAMAMTWISLGLSLLATLLPTIPGIISGFAALVGKTLTAAQLAKIQAIFAHITDILTQVQAAIQNFENNPVGSVLTEVKNLLNSLVASLNITAILNDLGITDSATVAKLSSIINVVLGLATDILNIIPSVAAGASKEVTKQISAAMSPQAVAARLNAAIWVKTERPDVDAIFEKIQAIPVVVKH